MRRILFLFLLFVIPAGGIFMGIKAGDRSIFTSPPEMVSEEFTRQLSLQRLPQALNYLSNQLKTKIGEKELAYLAGCLNINRNQVTKIDGDSKGMIGDHAQASARVRDKSGNLTIVDYDLSFLKGEWRIDRFHPRPAKGSIYSAACNSDAVDR